MDLHRIGWFNHDDDELELARYRDFNEQYIAQRSNASSAPYYHNGFSIKDDDYDARIKDRFDILSLAPSAVPEFAPDASYHLVPTNSGVPAGAASRNLQAHPSYITQISYGQSHHDEVRFHSVIVEAVILDIWRNDSQRNSYHFLQSFYYSHTHRPSVESSSDS